jgi:hypothetical protein
MEGHPMESHSARARFLLITTLVLALAGDILLRGGPWGAGFSVLTLLLFSGIALLSGRLRDPIPADAWLIVGFGLLTASSVAWRDSSELAVFNVMATLGAAALVTSRKHPGELARMRFADHVLQTIVQAYHVSAGFGLLLLRDLHADGEKGEARDEQRGRAWLGIALAIPALFVFGALLSSADAEFERLIEAVLPTDFWTIVGHVTLIAFFSWTIGGFLRGRFIAPGIQPSILPRPRVFSLGIMEIVILLGALDLLFGLFVGVQISYFFGGSDTVLRTPSLTYAVYARRGFFELIGVALLSLPLLLAADWLLRKGRTRDTQLFRALSIVMVALLGVMLASAMHRLWLYMDAYGLTTARLNAAAILVWVGATLVLFCVTVFREKRNVLPFAMVVSGFVVLLGLNAIDPDRLVARVNLDRMASDGNFDPKYTFRLSADAVPVLLQGMPAMESIHRSALAQQLVNRYGSGQSGQDIRSWNAARARAIALVRERESAMRGYILPSPMPAPECR